MEKMFLYHDGEEVAQITFATPQREQFVNFMGKVCRLATHQGFNAQIAIEK